MNSMDKNLIEQLQTSLAFKILRLANSYTGANFSEPPTKDQVVILKACSSFILQNFSSLSIGELDDAFSLATSGKLGEMNIEAYHGKFTVQMLGKVLRAYTSKRNGILSKYDDIIMIDERKTTEDEKAKKIEQARLNVLSEYKKLKDSWVDGECDLEMLEDKVYSYWGKILVDAKIIKFTHEEKKALVEEAKDLVKIELSNQMNDSLVAAERRSIRSILQDAHNLVENESYTLKWQNKYAKLIVIKSIIQG